MTNLDDGLRYQCAARWSEDTAYPEWSCGSNYAPIPGRETRDMGRSDYQALDRSTRIVVYATSQGGGTSQGAGSSARTTSRPSTATAAGCRWCASWARTGTCGCPTPSALADGPSRSRAGPSGPCCARHWDGLLDGSGPFVERIPPGQPPRFVKMFDLEDSVLGHDLSDQATRQAARRHILDVIEEYRAP